MAELTAARSNALPYPVYGVPWVIGTVLLDADGDPVSPSSPDSEVSKNFDTYADCTNEATEVATSSGSVYLILTGAEMTADVVMVQIKSTGAKTTVMALYPRKLVTLNSGTVGANAADGTTLQLAAGAVAIDDYYNGCLLVGTLDTNVEARVISDYNGSTLVCTVSPAFVTTPDNNDTYVVYLPEGRQVEQATIVGWVATALPSPDTAGYPKVTIKDGTGTGEIDTTSGGVLVAAIAAGAITAAAIAADAIGASELAADAVAEIADAVWDEATSGHTTSGTFGEQAKTDVDAILAAVDTEVAAIVAAIGTPSNLGSGATLAANLADIEAQTDDIGTAGAGLSAVPWNAAWDAEVQSEVDDALVAQRLDELLNADSDIDGAAPPTVGSVVHELMTKTAGSFTYDQATDSLEAVRDRGDAAWATATGFSTLDAAGVRTAVGLSSANLDTQLTAIDDAVDTEVAAVLAAVDTEVAAIKAKTDNLPSDPADASDIAASFATVNTKLDTIDDFLDTEMAAVLAAVDTEVAAIKAKTDNLPASPAAVGSQMTLEDGAITAAKIATDAITAAKVAADAIGASELATDAVAEIVAAVLTTQMTEAYAADGTAPTLAQALFLLLQTVSEFSISGTTITVKKLDGSTTAATFTLDSSSSPTSRTRAS